MLTHVLISVEHTVGHLVCNGGAGYISKVPALFKVKVNHFLMYSCMFDACMLWLLVYFNMKKPLNKGIYKFFGIKSRNGSPIRPPHPLKLVYQI
jgi:hypothetical protein